MELPQCLLPVTSIDQGRTDPVATWFYQRVPQDQSIPWSAWVVPLLTWGIFIAAMLATLVCLARLVIDQWMTNERLPFPLVQVQAALIESPPQGRALNDLLRNRWLWIGLGVVFVIHSLSTLNQYTPKFPRSPCRTT
jgi:hypothetical protein